MNNELWTGNSSTEGNFVVLVLVSFVAHFLGPMFFSHVLLFYQKVCIKTSFLCIVEMSQAYFALWGFQPYSDLSPALLFFNVQPS